MNLKNSRKNKSKALVFVVIFEGGWEGDNKKDKPLSQGRGRENLKYGMRGMEKTRERRIKIITRETFVQIS